MGGWEFSGTQDPTGGKRRDGCVFRANFTETAMRVACKVGLSCVVLAVLLTAGTITSVVAAPKGPNGETCTSTGTERRDGKDKDTGEKLNCLWDSCTYCAGPGGELDCSIKKTSYSNPRDCKPAARSMLDRLRLLNETNGLLDPGREGGGGGRPGPTGTPLRPTAPAAQMIR
jgi:hypothetical protein